MYAVAYLWGVIHPLPKRLRKKNKVLSKIFFNNPPPHKKQDTPLYVCVYACSKSDINSKIMLILAWDVG